MSLLVLDMLVLAHSPVTITHSFISQRFDKTQATSFLLETPKLLNIKKKCFSIFNDLTETQRCWSLIPNKFPQSGIQSDYVVIFLRKLICTHIWQDFFLHDAFLCVKYSLPISHILLVSQIVIWLCHKFQQTLLVVEVFLIIPVIPYTHR